MPDNGMLTKHDIYKHFWSISRPELTQGSVPLYTQLTNIPLLPEEQGCITSFSFPEKDYTLVVYLLHAST